MSIRSINPLLVAALMVLVPATGMLDFGETTTEPENELLPMSEASYAPTDPGHTVFAQYITSDNCGYCYSYGSPAHHQAKTNLPDKYVYISYHSASYGNTADAESGNIAPIMGVSHLQESGGAPKTSFGDATLETGCGSNTCWDSYISSGGNMHSTAADYALTVGQSDNGDGTSDVQVAAKYLGTGTPPSSLKLYAAVTEKVCHSHAYSDGSKGHNCWEAWLLNGGAYASNSGNVGGGTGFETISLSGGQWTTTTWTVPNNLVGQGATNMNVVAALFSDWSTSSFGEDVYAAADGTMQPPIDVAVQSFTVDNQDGAPGFMAGDTLDLEVTVRNMGADEYADGGTISLFHSEGGQDTLIDSTSLNTLTKGGASDTQTFSATFDSSALQITANGLEGFKATITGLTGDGNGANNVQMSYMEHDYTPSTDTPIAAGQTAIPRGGSLDFDITGNARDGVDTLATMTPEVEVSPAGADAWSGDWVVAPMSLTAPGTQYERYVFTVNPVQTAGSGDYDVRARMTDARGQVGEWSVASDAFSLMNGLPIVVDPTQPDNTPASCSAYPGMPTVKVETNERVSLDGIVCDAETPLNQLVITSSDPAFLSWHPTSGEIEVHFSSMQWDSMGNPLPQGIGISIDDGEDVNTGTLQFTVVENGQPRWSSVPAQSYDEGGSAQVNLAQYLSDTDANGNPASVMDLSLNVISIEPAGILDADVYGHSLAINAVDEDGFGSVVVTVRATDADGQLSETPVHVHVQNINDAPRFDSSGLEGLMVQVGHTLEIDLNSRMTDVDDDDAEIWTTVQSSTPGAAMYNPISGLLTATYEGPGQQTMTITASDSHGAEGTWQLVVDVVDTLPLEWSLDGTTGDLDIAVTGMHFGEDPQVFVMQLSELELTEIIASWSICNTQTGVCSDFGEEPIDASTLQAGHAFAAAPAAGNGMQNFDQLKVHIEAIDANGFDRESASVSYDASAAPTPVDETPTDGGDNEQTGTDDNTDVAGGMSVAVMGGILGLILLIVIAGVLAAMLLRGGREEKVDWGTEAAFAAPGAAPAMVAAPAAAPVAETAPDYTHLPVGGQYVTGHAGETVYLAPNGTAWTMQADNSFVRTS